MSISKTVPKTIIEVVLHAYIINRTIINNFQDNQLGRKRPTKLNIVIYYTTKSKNSLVNWNQEASTYFNGLPIEGTIRSGKIEQLVEIISKDLTDFKGYLQNSETSNQWFDPSQPIEYQKLERPRIRMIKKLLISNGYLLNPQNFHQRSDPSQPLELNMWQIRAANFKLLLLSLIVKQSRNCVFETEGSW